MLHYPTTPLPYFPTSPHTPHPTPHTLHPTPHTPHPTSPMIEKKLHQEGNNFQ
ncbi:hypothetical protein [Microcystis aeruginosa]|uniref:hypothetical protein n=1 Tax=Microcystis aeruginosa TaxID=1126 RepID=UPI000A4F0997|nr:hypothetical protein [Microcystis aeruginosa]